MNKETDFSEEADEVSEVIDNKDIIFIRLGKYEYECRRVANREIGFEANFMGIKDFALMSLKRIRR